MKSVIVEIRGKYAAALSEDGSIIKVRNHGYTVGQRIDTAVTTHVIPKRFMAIAACIALLLISGLGLYTYFTPYSYVSLDVNPSVEFTLNRFDCVLSVEGVNDDGRTLVEDINLSKLRNRPIDYAVVRTVNEISKYGYLEDAGISGIVIATSANSSKKAEKLAAELKAAVEYELLNGVDSNHNDSEAQDPTTSPQGEHEDPNANEHDKQKDTGSKADPSSKVTPSSSPSGNNSKGDKPSNNDKDKKGKKDKDDSPNDDKKSRKNKVIIESFNVSKDLVNEAKEKGVTPGRLRLVEKLQESAKSIEEIDIETWLDKPVREIMKATRKYKNSQPESDNRSDDDRSENNNDSEVDQRESSTGTNDKKDNNGNDRNRNSSGKSDKSDKPANSRNNNDKRNTDNVQQTGSKSDDDSHNRNTGKNESQRDKNNGKTDPSGKKNGNNNDKESPGSSQGDKSQPAKDKRNKHKNNDKRDNPANENKNKSGNKKIGNEGIKNNSKNKPDNNKNSDKGNSKNWNDSNNKSGKSSIIDNNNKKPINRGKSHARFR